MLSHVSVNAFYRVSWFYVQAHVFVLLDKLQPSSKFDICEKYIVRGVIIKAIHARLANISRITTITSVVFKLPTKDQEIKVGMTADMESVCFF